MNVAREMKILPRRFPIERINVAEKYSTPKPEDQTRCRRGIKTTDRTLETDNAGKAVGWPLRVADSIATLNRLRSSTHRKQPSEEPTLRVDLKAPTGTPIEAANSGRVVLAEELFFSGNTIIIDHGLALYTFYAHCSELLVSDRDVIRKRDIIGKVGATGRVTGPHLHWACRINTARVNPVMLTEAWIS